MDQIRRIDGVLISPTFLSGFRPMESSSVSAGVGKWLFRLEHYRDLHGKLIALLVGGYCPPKERNMRRTLLFAVPFVVLVTGCAPAPPGLPPPFAPGLEWAGLLLVAIGALVWLSRNGVSQFWHRNSHCDSDAWDYLRERYAKGDISREEYLRVASDLEANEQRHRS